jgi:phenylacetate-coenzyme A ligase PaaK-like adenylate-forming protein
MRAKELGVDIRRDIRGHADLKLLGFFPIDALRTRNVFDSLPAAMAADRFRLGVIETGGTTGTPARVVSRDFSWMRRSDFLVAGTGFSSVQPNCMPLPKALPLIRSSLGES